MPPRFAYWTILAGGLPTAFRAAEREELLPTFNRLKEKQPDAEMKYFARGKLWASPEEARRSAEGPARPRERRGPDWRPGGAHRDPRQPFKDAKKARNQDRRHERWERKNRPPRPHGDPLRDAAAPRNRVPRTPDGAKPWHNRPRPPQDQAQPRHDRAKARHDTAPHRHENAKPWQGHAKFRHDRKPAHDRAPHQHDRGKRPFRAKFRAERPPRPPDPNREPRPGKEPSPNPPPRPNEPEIKTPPPERGRKK